MSAYVMQEMTWPEIRDALEEAKLAILPVGSQEQHVGSVTPASSRHP